jgi:hypothetical protein
MKAMLYAIAPMLLSGISGTVFSAPNISGSPTIDSPPVLEWPRDRPTGTPDLTEPTSNRLWDLHAEIGECDLVLSTNGNYHMALRELWYDHFLPEAKGVADIKNWFYSTSPPISPEQIANQSLTFGNLHSSCTPSVAVGPKKLIQKLIDAGVVEGDPIPVIENQGNVILVKKGNPKKIRTVWDLGRPDVRVVTSNPYNEKGSFGNYSNTIYNIASNNPGEQKNKSADDLFNDIFNKQWAKNKWLSGARIHHREVPWSIAYGKADAGPFFYHLAKYAVEQFPDKFEIVPLGGTTQQPKPLTGNRIAKFFLVKIKGDWSEATLKSRELLIKGYLSPEFTKILKKHGLKRPEDFK